MQRPRARSDGLVVEELGNELLVYDLEANHGHSLGPEAARVWQRCDGRTPVEAMGAQLDLDIGTVKRALDELAACDLLEAATESITGSNGSTRRELTVRAVKAGAAVAAVPLIVSVVAPTPAQAATLAFCNSACPPPCSSGNCGDCCEEAFEGCCCCHDGIDPGDRFCVPADPGDATCKALHNDGHCSCGGV